MENTRENEARGGRPGGNSAGDGGRQMPANGFEGMNYEQRREPYYSRQQRSASRQNDEQSESSDHYRNTSS